MRRLRFTLPLVAIIALPGCSVYMAATGTEEPSFANVHEGATRGEVEATNQGTDYQMLVTYDATGHVTNIQTSKR